MTINLPYWFLFDVFARIVDVDASEIMHSFEKRTWAVNAYTRCSPYQFYMELQPLQMALELGNWGCI